MNNEWQIKIFFFMTTAITKAAGQVNKMLGMF